MEQLLASVSVHAESGTTIHALAKPSAAKAAARAELGLPVDKPIVMVGHQAEAWHAGILAKLIAADELAKRNDAALVWLTPDQDANEPTMVAYPACTHEGRLKRREWLVDAGAFVRPGTPTGSRLTIEPGTTPRDARTEWPHEAAKQGLDRLHTALSARRGEPSLARQYTGAMLDIARDALGIEVDATLMASTMARGAAFRMWADRMHREARGCVLAYNAAAQDNADAGVRSLDMAPKWELPLWALTPEKPRRPVFGDAPLPEQIAPRALSMTGFARTLLCDAWVMGTGGEAYDAVTHAWLDAWMGKADIGPGVVATATLRLPLRDGPLPDPTRAAGAAWRLHHARHHPEMLDQHDRQQKRDEIVKAITDAPRHSSERRRLFNELRSVLHEARNAGGATLDAMRQNANAEHERLQDMDQVLDRTWPFALHDDAALRDLDAHVREATAVLA